MVAPTDNPEPVKNAYEYLLTQGVLGVLCVLLIFALIWSVKTLLKAKDDRITDQSKYAEALKEINEAVRDLTIEMNKSSTDKANELLRRMDTLVSTSSSIERSIDGLKTEQTRMGAAFSAKQGYR